METKVTGEVLQHCMATHNVFAQTQYFVQSKDVTVSAGDKIHLVSGDSSITLEKNGTITIKGMNIEIISSQDTSVEASGQIDFKSKALMHLEGKPFMLASTGKGNIETSAPLTIKGGQVKINC
jgi:hypothetical protein